MVTTCPANQPVIAQIAKDAVITIARQTVNLVGGIGACAIARIKVEQEGHSVGIRRRISKNIAVGRINKDQGPRAVLVIGGKFGRTTIRATPVKDISRITGIVIAEWQQGEVIGHPVQSIAHVARHCLGTRNSIRAISTVQRIRSQTAKDDIIVTGRAVRDISNRISQIIRRERRQIDCLFQRVVHMDHSLMDVTIGRDQLIRSDCSNTVKRFGQTRVCSILRRPYPTIAADHAVLPGTARHPVMAVTADDVVVFTVTIKRIVADQSVKGVVTAFAVDFIPLPQIARSRDRVYVGTSKRIVDHFSRTHHDPFIATGVGCVMLVCIIVQCVIVERHIAAVGRVRAFNHTENTAIVAKDHIRIAGVTLFNGNICRTGVQCAKVFDIVVARNSRARTTKQDIGARRGPLVQRIKAVEVGVITKDIVLPEVTKDQVVAAVAFNIVVAVFC